VTGRKIRLKNELPSEAKVKNGRVINRSVPQLLKDAQELGVEEVGVALTEKEHESLIEYGGEQDVIKKLAEKEVTVIKAILLAHAKASGEVESSSKSFGFKVSPRTATVFGTATDLARILKKHKKMQLFDELVTVKVTETKKYLGEQILIEEGFMKKETEKFGSTSLKKK